MPPSASIPFTRQSRPARLSRQDQFLPINSIERRTIEESSYLLDATRYNGLWFHQFCERNWLNLNSLLGQSVEQFAA